MSFDDRRNTPTSNLFKSNKSFLHAKHARTEEKAKRKSAASRIALSVITTLAIALLVFLAYISSINSSFGNFASDAEKAALIDSLTDTKEGGYYVAIIGSDEREEITVGRSDVLMLARIEESTGKVTLVSIPRDMMVEIDGHGTQKINAAYTYGGAAGAVQCLSDFAGVPISHYVEVHFEEFASVIDSLGGVTVNVPETITTDAGFTYPEGEQLLDGAQALTLARERHNTSNGDVTRTQSQRAILEGVAREVLASSPLELPMVVSSIASCVTTDYTVGELVSLARSLQVSGLTVYSCSCPSYLFESEGYIFAGVKYEEWKDMMGKVDSGLDPLDPAVTIPEYQACNNSLGSASNALSPRNYENLG